MTMPQPPIASNVSIAVDQFLAHRRLHLQVDRQAQRIGLGAQPFVEVLLDAGKAALVHIDAAQHLRRGAAQRILPVLRRAEIDARNAQVVDRQFLARRDLARQVDELLVALQPFGRLRQIQPRQHLLQLVRRIVRVADLPRVGEQRHRVQRDRHRLAVAVGDHRPLAGQRRLDRTGAAAAATISATGRSGPMRRHRHDDRGQRQLAPAPPRTAR